MRIISNYQDYYDGVQRYGADPSVVFERHKKQLEGEFAERLQRRICSNQVYTAVNAPNVDLVIVLFCGELWYGVSRIGIDDPDIRNIPKRFHPKVKGVKTKGRLYSIATSYDVIELTDWEKNLLIRKWIGDKFISIYDAMKNNPHDAFDLMVDEQLAIATWFSKYKTITINDRLQDHQFYKVKDTYTAYQDLSMWISGVLPSKENDTLDVSDEDLARQKGFTHKYNFRREPTKRR